MIRRYAPSLQDEGVMVGNELSVVVGRVTQKIKRVDSGVVTITEGDVIGIRPNRAHCFDGQRFRFCGTEDWQQGRCRGLLLCLAAFLFTACRARAIRAQDLGGPIRAMSVGPSDGDAVVVITLDRCGDGA